MKGLLLLGIIVAFASCKPPEPVLENQIRINGTVYPINSVYIYDLGADSRGVALYFDDGPSETFLGFTFENQTSEIPAGSWAGLDSDFVNMFCDVAGTYYTYNSSTGTSLSLTISGVEGGTLQINGNVNDTTTPEFDCAVDYTGPYQ